MYYKQLKNIIIAIVAFLPLLVKCQINYGSNNGKFLTIRGTKVYYEEYGKGVPLLMLHGGFGDITDFQKVIPKLSEKYRVIIPDAPGLGRSEYADSILSYQLLADYSSKFIDLLKSPALQTYKHYSIGRSLSSSSFCSRINRAISLIIVVF